MPECALLIALLLHRPFGLVSTVYDMAGLSGVCVVEFESNFSVTACKREEKGGTSWGLWQLWSVCHPQYRDELLAHIVYGAEFWKACLEKSCRVSVQGGRTGRQRGRQVAGGAVRFGALPLGAEVEKRDGHATMTRAQQVSAPSIAVAYSFYNSGSPTRSIEKGRALARRYESLALYLWRRLR
jgi:hypothetical protein